MPSYNTAVFSSRQGAGDSFYSKNDVLYTLVPGTTYTYTSTENQTTIGNGTLGEFNNGSLTSFICGDTVTNIGLDAFNGATNLTSCQINNVLSIGIRAFRNTGLVTLSAPNLINLEQNAFSNSYRLNNFNVSKSVAVIRPYAFSATSMKITFDSYTLPFNFNENIFSRSPDTPAQNSVTNVYVPFNSATNFYNQNLILSNLISSIGQIHFVYPPCFKQGSKILTDKGYKLVEELRKGDLIKTLKNDYLPIVLIGKSPIHNSGDNERIKNRLYNLSIEKYPELTEDLVLTGCHSLLVDILTKEQEDATLANYGEFKITEGKVRLETYLDPKADPYPEEGTFIIYHLALENENYFSNYGIWANGLLVESCSKRYLTELSGMELIE